MAERNDSHLLDGGDSVGMTDNQYKGNIALKESNNIDDDNITDL